MKMTATTTTPATKGYVMTFAKITKPSEFKAYSPMVGPTLVPYGGKMLQKSMLADAAYVENKDQYTLAVVLEFPSEQHATDWYNSEEYKDAKALRIESSKGPLVVASGVDADGSKAFVLGFFKIENPEPLSKYNPAASFAKYEGKVLMKATEPKDAENFDDFTYAGLLGFPTLNQATSWMASDEYKEAKAIRIANMAGPVAILGAN